MQSYDLSVLKLLDHAARYHSDAGIFSFSSKNVKSFRSWAEARERARALAAGLQGLGVRCVTPVAAIAAERAAFASSRVGSRGHRIAMSI